MCAGYGSHIPILSKYLSYLHQTIEKPRILELGIGWYSTPVIQMMGGVTYPGSTPFEWRSELLRITYAYSITNQTCLSKEWDFIFVDSWPEDSRVKFVLQLLDKCPTFMLHDSNDDWEPSMQYSVVKGHFKYVKNYELFYPNTMILSQNPIPDLQLFSGELG